MSEIINEDLLVFKDIFYISAKDLSIPAYPESESFIDVTNDTVLLRSDYPDLSNNYPTSGTFSLFGSKGDGDFSNASVNVTKSDGIYIRTWDSQDISFSNNPSFSVEAYKNIDHFYNFSSFIDNKFFRQLYDNSTGTVKWGLLTYSYTKSDNMSQLVNSIYIENENPTFFEEIPGVDPSKITFYANQVNSGQNENYVYFRSSKFSGSTDPEGDALNQMVFCSIEDFRNDFFTSQSFKLFNYKHFDPDFFNGRDSFLLMNRNGSVFLNRKGRDNIILLNPFNETKIDEILLSDYNAASNGNFTVSQAMDGVDYLIINGSVSSFIFEISLENGFVFVEKIDGISIGYYTPGCYFYAETPGFDYDSTFNKINTNGVVQDLTALGLTYNFLVSRYYYENHAAFCSRRIVDHNEIQIRGTNDSYVYFLKFIEDTNTFTIKGQDYGNGEHKTWILGV